MIQAILDWLHENYSDGFLLYLAIICTIYIVWFIAKVYFEKIKGGYKKTLEVEKKIEDLPCTKHEDNLKEAEMKIEQKIENLPCAKHEDNIRSIDVSMAEIRVKLGKLDNLEDICQKHEGHLRSLDENMTKIITILSVKDPSATAAFSLKHSPSQLNDIGKKLFDACGGARMLKENGDFLIGLMEKGNPETALDVENKAYEVLLSNSYMSIFNHIKQWIYNCPEWEIDSKKRTISLQDVCFVLSLYLRDLYLEKHPNIPTGEE